MALPAPRDDRAVLSLRLVNGVSRLAKSRDFSRLSRRTASRAAAAPRAAPHRGRGPVTRRLRRPRALLDIALDQTPHDLGGRGVFLRAQPLEQRLLARIDEDRQS